MEIKKYMEKLFNFFKKDQLISFFFNCCLALQFIRLLTTILKSCLDLYFKSNVLHYCCAKAQSFKVCTRARFLEEVETVVESIWPHQTQFEYFLFSSCFFLLADPLQTFIPLAFEFIHPVIHKCIQL